MFPSLSVWPATHLSFTNIAVTDKFWSQTNHLVWSEEYILYWSEEYISYY